MERSLADIEVTRSALLQARNVFPSWSEVAGEARQRAAGIEVGRTLFMKAYGVESEADYKRLAKRGGRIMTHAHIGLATWDDTKLALHYLYEETSKRSFRVDRFGLCLDRGMAYPPEMRDKIPPETGPRLESLEDWIEVGQVVPIQPHAGDFMIGFPASMTNTLHALQAGITTIGNLSQYFGHGSPEWTDEAFTAVETAKALALMGAMRSQGALVHSYLEDGFGALFTDYSTVAGWALLEKYLVEDLCGGKIAHCFGGLTNNPLHRAAWALLLNEIHGEDCLGSMLYGDTISSTTDETANLAINAEQLIWDMAVQLLHPTGHAVHPVPVTEAVRIPSAEEITHIHVFARYLEDAARRLAPVLDLEPAQKIKDRFLSLGREVFDRALDGLSGDGVDIANPLELLFVLKKVGALGFERLYGAGPEDPAYLGGRKPAALTDMFSRTFARSQSVMDDLGDLGKQHMSKLLLASTDVHVHGLIVIERALDCMGFTTVLAGVELSPAEIARQALENQVTGVIVATYNGNALEIAKAVRYELRAAGLKIPIFMGGRLNQVEAGSILPKNVENEINELGVRACSSIPDCLRLIDDLVN
jgi:methylmalonyl-CoA mutase cobalamin-binding domain/chain